MSAPELFVRHGRRYVPAAPHMVSEAAVEYVQSRINLERPVLESPRASHTYLTARLAHLEHEEFHALFLDSRHRVIRAESLFRGTIDGTSVHPREVVKRALQVNAAAAIFAHNHPSGVAEPSQADELITLRLREGLALVEIRVLDHIIVPGGMASGHCTSLAERGLI